MNLPLLCQRNPSWSEQKIGASQLTLGKYGCTTTSLSELSFYFGCPLTPPQIAKNIDWYTPEGLVIWRNLKFTNFTFEKRLNSRIDAAINESLKDPDKAVMVEVEGRHWLTVIGKTFWGNDWKAIDPWFGGTCNVLQRYKYISGSSHFKRAKLNI